MKYSKGDIVENTFCQWEGRDEVLKCRDLIAPYPFEGTVKKCCSDFHQMAFALSYSIEEVQRIIRFRIGDPEWKHPLKFTDIINAVLMARKGLGIDPIVAEIQKRNTQHYRDQIRYLAGYCGQVKPEELSHIKNLLTAFLMFPIVWDRFFKPKLNCDIKLHSSIIDLGNQIKHMLPSDFKMISSDKKWNELAYKPVALSWGLEEEVVKQIDEEYRKLTEPVPMKKVEPAPVTPSQVTQSQAATQSNATVSREVLEAEVKKGNSVLIDINGVKCKLTPVNEENKKAYTEFLPLSQRLINVLVANDLNNLAEILEYFDGMTLVQFMENDKFLKLHNFGRKSAREMFEFLSTIKI